MPVAEPEPGAARDSVVKSYSSWGRTESVMHTVPRQPEDSDVEVPLYDVWPTYPSDEEDHEDQGGPGLQH